LEFLDRADHRLGRVALGFGRVFGRRRVGLDSAEAVVEGEHIGGIVGLAVAGGSVQRKKVEFVDHGSIHYSRGGRANIAAASPQEM